MREVGWGGVESREGGVERGKKWASLVTYITGYVSCADSLECPGPDKRFHVSIVFLLVSG